MTVLGFEAPSESDLREMTAQLGRPVRGVLAIAARLASGTPAVALTAPRLDDGTPFPTLYYLTEPTLTAAVSRLEADGYMAVLQQRLEDYAELQAAYTSAHLRYLAERDSIAEVPEVAGFSAGGMPERVKCLHALVGHSLASGPGVNPIGDAAILALPPAVQGILDASVQRWIQAQQASPEEKTAE
ncbi:MAG: DUF501 domain-containing protein [Microbacteriaceae bacterium]